MKFISFLKSKTFWLNAGLALVFYTILALSANWILKGITSHSEVAVVPDLSGLNLDAALKKLHDHNLEGEVLDSSSFTTEVAPESVVEQYPIAGSKAKEGRVIMLTINKKRDVKISLPKLVERTLQRAELDLTSRGLRIGNIRYVPDLAEGLVLEVRFGGQLLPEGSKVRKGTAVDLVVGKRSMAPTHAVPNILGMRFGEARAILQLSGLRIQWMEGDTLDPYLVVYKQTPDFSDGIFVTQENAQISVWLGDDYLFQDEE